MSLRSRWAALEARWSAVAPRRKAVLALLLVFAAGLGGGALLEDIVDELDRPLFAADDSDDDDAGDLSEETVLAHLDLTAEQRERIERVFEAREDRLERYWDARLPELESVIDSSRDEIRAILTPAQRSTYDSQLARLRFQPRRHFEEDDHD